MTQQELVKRAIEIEGEPPAWMKLAAAALGVQEIPGKGHNPRIVGWHQTTTLGARDDETAWCSSFVNAMLTAAGIKGTNSAAAISWESWGRSLEVGRIGAVTTILRTGGSGRHVGFYVMEPDWMDPEDPEYFVYLLGGNQSNQVRISPYAWDRVMDFRWPR